VGDGEKLLKHLNSALKVLLGLDIFPRVPKKKLNFVDQFNQQLINSLTSCATVIVTVRIVTLAVRYLEFPYFGFVETN